MEFVEKEAFKKDVAGKSTKNRKLRPALLLPKSKSKANPQWESEDDAEVEAVDDADMMVAPVVESMTADFDDAECYGEDEAEDCLYHLIVILCLFRCLLSI